MRDRGFCNGHISKAPGRDCGVCIAFGHQLQDLWLRSGVLLRYEPTSKLVTTATKPMNALELVRRQIKRQEAIKQAQKANATTLCYRGICYVKQQSA